VFISVVCSAYRGHRQGRTGVTAADMAMALEYNGTPVTDLLRCVRYAFDMSLCTDYFSDLFFLLLVCLRSASLSTCRPQLSILPSVLSSQLTLIHIRHSDYKDTYWITRSKRSSPPCCAHTTRPHSSSHVFTCLPPPPTTTTTNNTTTRTPCCTNSRQVHSRVSRLRERPSVREY
jgi:hypothetical protein